MRKNSLLICIAMALLFTAMALLSGGCSSGGGGNNVTGIPLAFDTDKDGIPDVFDNRPEITSEFALETTVNQKNDGDKFNAGVFGEGAPLSVPRTIEGSILPPVSEDVAVTAESGDITVTSRDTDIDIYALNLEAGKQYSVVFYDSQDRGGRAVSFTPGVWVTPVSGLREEMVVGEDQDEHGNPVTVEHVIAMRDRVATGAFLPLTVNVAAPENTGAVILTFKTNESGLHYLAVSNADAEQSKALPYRFDIFEDEDGDGMLNKFSSSDGSYSFNYTFRDILYLQSVLAKYVAKSNDLGFPTEFLVDGITEEDGGITHVTLPPLKTAWEEALAQVNSYHAKAPAGSKCSLNPFIMGLRWNDGFREGWGYDAASGLQATKYNSAIEPFKLNRDKIAPKDETTAMLISTAEEHERAIGANVSASFGPGKDAPKVSVGYSENIKYSSTAVTLTLNYDREETEYRLLHAKEYKMTPAAKEYLKKNGPEKFRQEYGDYFVAGAKYGAKYFATISIKTKTSEKLNEVKAACSNIPIKGGKVDAEFTRKFREATKDTQIVMRRVRIGGFNGSQNDSESGAVESGYWNGIDWSGNEEYVVNCGDDGAQGELSIEALLKDMDQFIDDSKKENFLLAKRYVYLLRFNQIPDGGSIPTEIDLDPAYFIEMRKLSRDLLGVIAKNNVIQDISEDDIQSGSNVKVEFRERFARFCDDFEINVTRMIKDINVVKEYRGKIAGLDKEFQDFLDRYYFFTKLRSWWSFNSGTGERGYRNWTISSTVNNDIDRGSDKEWYWNFKSAWRHGRWEKWQTWEVPSDRRVCYLNVKSHCDHDRSQDDNVPSITRRLAKFYFCGGDRRYVNWEIYGSRFNDTAYPFNWKYN